MATYTIDVIKNPDVSNNFEVAEMWYSEQVLTEEEIYHHIGGTILEKPDENNEEIPEDLHGNPNVWRYNNPDPHDGLMRTVNYLVLRDEDFNLYGFCRMIPPLDLNRSYITFFSVKVNEGNTLLDITFNKARDYKPHYSNRNELQHKWFGRNSIEFPWSGYYYLGSCYAMIQTKDPALIDSAEIALNLIDAPQPTDIHFAESKESRAIVPLQNNVLLEDGTPLSSHVFFRLDSIILHNLQLELNDIQVSTDITRGILAFSIKPREKLMPSDATHDTEWTRYWWEIYVFGSGTNLWNHVYQIEYNPNDEHPLDLSTKYYSKVYLWKDQLLIVIDHTMYIVSEGTVSYQPIEYDMIPSCFVHHKDISYQNGQATNIQILDNVVVPENFDLTEMLFNLETYQVTQYAGKIPSNAEWKDLLDIDLFVPEIGGIFDYNGTEVNSIWSFLSSASQVKALRHTKKELYTYILDSGVVSIDPTNNVGRFYLNNLRVSMSEGIIPFRFEPNMHFNGDINGINLTTPKGLIFCTPNTQVLYNLADARGIRGFKFTLLNHTVL